MRSLTLRARFLTCLLCCCAAAWWATPPQAAQARTDTLPADLALVPPDSMYFLHAKLDELYHHPVIKNFLKHLPPDVLTELEKESQKDIGLRTEDMGRFTMFMKMTSPVGQDNHMVMLFSTKAPYDKQKLLKAIVPNAQEKKAEGKVYYAPKESQFGMHVHFPDDRHVMLIQNMSWGENDPKVMDRFFASLATKKGPGPLTDIIASAKDKPLVMGVHIPESLQKIMGEFGGLPEEVSWLEPLFQLKTGSLTVDLGDTTTLRLRLQFPEAGKAKDAEEATQHGLRFVREQVATVLSQMQEKAAKSKNNGDMSHSAVKLLQIAETTLKTARMQLQGNDLQVTLAVKTDDAALAQLAKFVVAVREQELGSNNLRQIGIAMHNYHGDFEYLPKHATCDKNGKPLLSWRVALLPYLGQDELFKQFKQDEPWDSDHNKKLLAKMPDVYRHPRLSGADSHLTYYKVFVSQKGDKPAAAFVGNEKITLGKLAVADGTSNTVMAIEGGESVPWTKPEDIPFDAKKPLPNLEKHFPNGWHVLFCDGSVRKIKKGAVEKLLKQIITYNGGETDDTAGLFVD